MCIITRTQSPDGFIFSYELTLTLFQLLFLRSTNFMSPLVTPCLFLRDKVYLSLVKAKSYSSGIKPKCQIYSGDQTVLTAAYLIHI